jgi:hypothetical protein
MARSTFIKAGTTSTAVSKSKADIEKMLRRYGASAFNVTQDFASRRSSVSFVLPNDPSNASAQVPIRLHVETQRVAKLLHGKNKTLTVAQLEQAERVAWRNLALWIDAALSAASIGMQTITEAFFAHTVVGVDGERMIDLVGAHQKALGSGVQRLLTAAAETE